jgi:hypothetical protein
VLRAATLGIFGASDDLRAVGGLVVAGVITILLLVMLLRQGRNAALEQIVAEREFKAPLGFMGTLAVEEYKPGVLLRLARSTNAARNLQWRYRWLGVGRQAMLDEVSFDRYAGVVRLRKKDTETSASFLEYSAIRMREVTAGRGGISTWHVELVRRAGRITPFVTSVSGSRQASFEHTAPVAKAAAEIMQVPIQVWVAGNVSTPGWPPKRSQISDSKLLR